MTYPWSIEEILKNQRSKRALRTAAIEKKKYLGLVKVAIERVGDVPTKQGLAT